jgi:ubiquitin conjugation factor E4 B
MLNLMSVLQHLSSKVRMDKVEPAYLHTPACRLVLKEEARLKASSQEAAEYTESLAKSGTVKVSSNWLGQAQDLQLWAC